jgi:hypothetical protein
VDWGLALRLVEGDTIRCHGTGAFAADGYFFGDASLPVHPVMDLAAIAYTWLAIVYGNGEAPWDCEDISRADWVEGRDAEAKRVKTYLHRVYNGKAIYNWK